MIHGKDDGRTKFDVQPTPTSSSPPSLPDPYFRPLGLSDLHPKPRSSSTTLGLVVPVPRFGEALDLRPRGRPRTTAETDRCSHGWTTDSGLVRRSKRVKVVESTDWRKTCGPKEGAELGGWTTDCPESWMKTIRSEERWTTDRSKESALYLSSQDGGAELGGGCWRTPGSHHPLTDLETTPGPL